MGRVRDGISDSGSEGKALRPQPPPRYPKFRYAIGASLLGLEVNQQERVNACENKVFNRGDARRHDCRQRVC
jgi:hypothetical protein